MKEKNITFPIGTFEQGEHRHTCGGCNQEFLGGEDSRVCQTCYAPAEEYWNSYKNPMREIIDEIGTGVTYFRGTIYCGNYGSPMLDMNWYDDMQVRREGEALESRYEILTSTIVDDIGKFITEAIEEKIQREMEKLK